MSNVHVHLSDTKCVGHGHIMQWYLPQLHREVTEATPIIPPDEDLGQLTNGSTQITPDTALTLSSSSYNVAIILDMSASMFTVDMYHKKVVIEELNQALKKCVKPLSEPRCHPWNTGDYSYNVTVSVIAFTPQMSSFLHVLIQGYVLLPENTEYLLKTLDKECTDMHRFIKKRIENRELTKDFVPESSDENKHRPNGLYSLIKQATKIIDVQKTQCSRENSKSVIIMITDGVVGQSNTPTTTQIVQKLQKTQTSCSFVRVGARDPIHYGFGYIPNISLLQFVASASGGHYWDWGDRDKIPVQKALVWSNFCDPVDVRKLESKYYLSQEVQSVSFVSTVATKLYEGFRITNIALKSCPDIDGNNTEQLELKMVFVWRKRIHVVYELSTQLPLTTFTQKVVVSMSVWADYNFIKALSLSKQGEMPATMRSLMYRFKMREDMNFNPGDRWISKLHNYSRLKELSKVPVLVSGTKLPLFERMDCSRLDRERVMEWLGGDNEKNREFKGFWERFPRFCEESSMFNNFDMFELRCWLQFDLPLPKCLTGTKTRNKENQIHRQSFTYIMEALQKWCTFTLLENELFVKQYETKEDRNSFVWVQRKIRGPPMPAMTFYIAFHRDIAFQEQDEILVGLRSILLQIPMPGNQILSHLKIGSETPQKTKLANYMPITIQAKSACHILPKSIDKILLWDQAFAPGVTLFKLYLHRLISTWRICSDTSNCNETQLLGFRNEVFNALVRLRLQQEFKPVSVSGRSFSFFLMLEMVDVTEDKLVLDNHEGKMCLVQYKISVEDTNSKKASHTFTTEIWVEPQWGRVMIPPGYNDSLSFLRLRKPNELPALLFEKDHKLVASISTFMTLKDLCSNEESKQPSPVPHTCPAPLTSYREIEKELKMPYLFQMWSLLEKSQLTQLTLPLIKTPDAEEGSGEDVASPNAHMLRALCEKIRAHNHREIILSAEEKERLITNVNKRCPDGPVVDIATLSSVTWRCFVQFNQNDDMLDSEDDSRLLITYIPDIPLTALQSEVEAWFGKEAMHVFVFDCHYKVITTLVTNSSFFTKEMLYSCDSFVSPETVCTITPPKEIADLLTRDSEHGTESTVESVYNYMVNIVEGYRRSYVLGVHHAIQSNISLLEECVSKALDDFKRDETMMKYTKVISLAKYLSSVCTCSHLSTERLRRCLSSPLAYNAPEPPDDQHEEECDLQEESDTYPPSTTTTGQTSEFSEDSEESATPLAGGTKGTVMMPLKQLPLNSSTYGESEDALCFEIMLGSSSELTPIAPPIPQKYKGEDDASQDESDESPGGQPSLEALREIHRIERTESDPSVEVDLEDMSCLSLSDVELDPPMITIQPSTPFTQPLTEQKSRIKSKFQAIIEENFLPIQYSNEYLVMKADLLNETENGNVDSFYAPLFLQMVCRTSLNECVIQNLPTCISDLADMNPEFQKDIELHFNCYTLPDGPPASPTFHSPRSSFVKHRANSRPELRYDFTLRKSSTRSAPALDSDDQIIHHRKYSVSNKDFLSNRASRSDSNTSTIDLTRVERQGSSMSSISRQESLPPIDHHKKVLALMYGQVEWLVDDHYIHYLRRRTPVAFETLKQVMKHCSKAVEGTKHCKFVKEPLIYVELWDKGSDVRQTRFEDLQNKLQSEIFDQFRLCKINNFFYYVLLAENEHQELHVRDAASNHSSISSLGARSSLNYMSSSSSMADELSMNSCKMKPSSKCWIVIELTESFYKIAYHCVDSGANHQIDDKLVSDIISRIKELNKRQNQEFMLQHLEEKKQCAKELIEIPPPQGIIHYIAAETPNYACDIVHTTRVNLFDTSYASGMNILKNALANLQSENKFDSKSPVYVYTLNNVPRTGGGEEAEEPLKVSVQNIFYFQLPTCTDPKQKYIEVNVRGLSKPFLKLQDNLDTLLKQQLEDTKLERIAERLSRNQKSKLTPEEVRFLGNPNQMADTVCYLALPSFATKFLPHLTFYLDQYLKTKLFTPKYMDASTPRMKIFNSTSKELEDVRDDDLYMWPKFNNRRINQEADNQRSHYKHALLFQAILLANISLVDASEERVVWCKEEIETSSPLISYGQEPPSAEMIKHLNFSNTLGAMPLNLRVQIIERRKKSGSTQHYIDDFQDFLLSCFKISLVTLILELYILPAHLTKNIDSLAACLESSLVSPLSLTPAMPTVTPSPLKASITVDVEPLVAPEPKPSLLNRMRRRKSTDSMSEAKTYIELDRRSFYRTFSVGNEQQDASPVDSNLRKEQRRLKREKPVKEALHPALAQPCFTACKVGAGLKMKFLDHTLIHLPSIFSSDIVLNHLIKVLIRQFQKSKIKVRVFKYAEDEKEYILQPIYHYDGDFERCQYVLVARDMEGSWKDSQKRLGHDEEGEGTTIPGILALEPGVHEGIQVPRQMHILASLKNKKLDLWFYNLHKDIRDSLVKEIKEMSDWLDGSSRLLTRILLCKLRIDTPPDRPGASWTPLPRTSELLYEFIKQTQGENPKLSKIQKQTLQLSIKKQIVLRYEQIYETYHPEKAIEESKTPLGRHGNQLADLIATDEGEKKADDMDYYYKLFQHGADVTLDRDQAKELKKMSRLLHYIASPLLFSAKRKNSGLRMTEDQDHFTFLPGTSEVPETKWFLKLKDQLLEKFVNYLQGSAIGMKQIYQGKGTEEDVDDDESLLYKHTSGGIIIVHVMVQSTTFCVKLYGYENQMSTFKDIVRFARECSDLKMQTHTNSFHYDWMAHSVYDELKSHDDPGGVSVVDRDKSFPLLNCIQDMIDFYQYIPPFVRCWVKECNEQVIQSQYRIEPDRMYTYMIENAKRYGMQAIPSQHGQNILFAFPQFDRQMHYKIGVILSKMCPTEDPGGFSHTTQLHYYIILVNSYLEDSPAVYPNIGAISRRRLESYTYSNESTSSSPDCDSLPNRSPSLSMQSTHSETEGSSYNRSRVMSYNFSSFAPYDMKLSEIRAEARRKTEDFLKRVVHEAQSHLRRDLIWVRLTHRRERHAMDLSKSFSAEDLSASPVESEITELIGLSSSMDLLECDPPHYNMKRLLHSCTVVQYKAILQYLAMYMKLIRVPGKDRLDIGIALRTNTTNDTETLTVLKFENNAIKITGVVKTDDGKGKVENIKHWESVMNHICVYYWDKMASR